MTHSKGATTVGDMSSHPVVLVPRVLVRVLRQRYSADPTVGATPVLMGRESLILRLSEVRPSDVDTNQGWDPMTLLPWGPRGTGCTCRDADDLCGWCQHQGN